MGTLWSDVRLGLRTLGRAPLFTAAGLFVCSAMSAQSVDLGFDPSHVLNVSVDVAQQGYDETRGRAFFEELLRRAKEVPGVEAASFALSVPLGYYNTSSFFDVEGPPPADKSLRPAAGFNLVTPEYAQAMRPHLLKGRFFTAADNPRSRAAPQATPPRARRPCSVSFARSIRTCRSATS